MSGSVNSEQTVHRLLEALPEFGPEYKSSLGAPAEPGDELLIHVIMGHLARFYMEHGTTVAARAGQSSRS